MKTIINGVLRDNLMMAVIFLIVALLSLTFEQWVLLIIQVGALLTTGWFFMNWVFEHYGDEIKAYFGEGELHHQDAVPKPTTKEEMNVASSEDNDAEEASPQGT